MTEEQIQPWYKQFWPWFLIALPGSVVIASIATIIIAVNNPDSVVVDDYYKAGLGINRNLSRELLATQLGINANLIIHDKLATISLSSAKNVTSTDLQLKLMHPTLPDKDQIITLSRIDSNTFSGAIIPPAQGTWNLSIESDAPSWRIQKRIKIDPSENSFKLP